MGVSCEILFDNNTYGIYYSGQTISGVVKLTLGKVKKIRGLILKIEGYAKCSWQESSGAGKNRRTVHYSGREDYLHTLSYLIGSREGNQIDLKAGVHIFNFACVLPPGLPTSFEAPNGYIRYTTKVTLERPWKFDMSFVNAFTVIKPMDLNYEVPNLNAPLRMETTKKFWFTFGGGSNFNMNASIPISGFVAGQNVNVLAEVDNQSNVDVVYLKISLKRYIEYHSTLPSKVKKEIRTEGEMRCKGVGKKEKKNYNELFRIPATPPTNILFCRVIKIYYELQIKAKVSGINTSPVMRFPITIGTIPLFNFPQNGQMPMPTAPAIVDRIDNASGPSHTNDRNRNFELPPPSYEECTKNDPIQYEEEEEDKNTVTQKNFNPRYPVYQFRNPIGFNIPNDFNTYHAPSAPSPPVQSDEKTPL